MKDKTDWIQTTNRQLAFYLVAKLKRTKYTKHTNKKG